MIVHVGLPDDLAWALAEFLTRVGYSDYRPLAADEQEARDIQGAGEKLRAALADQGFAPR
jgi:hypothetical protein